MNTYPVDVVGDAYESRSKPLSAQVTRNLYPEINPTGEALQSWPGEKLIVTGEGRNRGATKREWKGHIYYVNGNYLMRQDSLGAVDQIGLIPGAGKCLLEPSLNYVYVVTGGLVYRTDGTSLEAVTDSDLETPNSVAFINSQMIYDGDQGRFWLSEAGDGGDINSLRFASAESSPDELIRVYSFRQQVLMFGTDSFEPWYNSGAGTVRMTRIENGLRPVGLASVHGITNTDTSLYFLGHDRSIYRMEGYEPLQVSTIAINHAIENYEDVSDCEAHALKLQGQSILIFSFPAANKTWCYSETFNKWFEISSGLEDGAHLLGGYCYAFGKHYVFDRFNGNTYQWDVNTFDSNGETIIRERVLPPISGKLVGQTGKRILCSRLEVIFERGLGTATGQGQNPYAMISVSEDGGKYFSQEDFVELGELGDYTKKIEYFHFASGYEIVYKIRVSDPIFVSITAAAVDAEFAGY